MIVPPQTLGLYHAGQNRQQRQGAKARPYGTLYVTGVDNSTK